MPSRRLESVRGRCPPPGGRERATVSRPRVCAIHLPVRVRSHWSGPTPGAAPGRRRGRLVAPGCARASRLLGPKGWRECEGGAGRRGRLGTRVRAAAGQLRSALRAPALGRLGSPAPSPGRSEPGAQGWASCRSAGASRAPSPPGSAKSEVEKQWLSSALLLLPFPGGAAALAEGGGEVRSAGLEGKARRPWAVPPPPSSRPRPRGFTQHFFVLKAPPPPRGFSPAGPADGGGVGHRAVGPPSI